MKSVPTLLAFAALGLAGGPVDVNGFKDGGPTVIQDSLTYTASCPEN